MSQEQMPEEGKKLEARLYHEGPNFSADAVITRKRDGVWEVLLIKRSNGKWGFPGGFRDPLKDENGNDTDALEEAETAMFREAVEETGIAGIESVPHTKIYEGPVKDERTEGEPGEPGARWIETTAYHLDVTGLPGMEPKDTGDSGIYAYKWEPITPELAETLHGSHGDILKMVMKTQGL